MEERDPRFDICRNPSEIAIEISAGVAGYGPRFVPIVLWSPSVDIQAQFAVRFQGMVGRYQLLDEGRDVARQMMDVFEKWKEFTQQRPQFRKIRGTFGEFDASSLLYAVDTGIEALEARLDKKSFADDDGANPKGPLMSLKLIKPIVEIATKLEKSS